MERLLEVIQEATRARLDKDLFVYEIPLDKSGAWVSDSGNARPRHGADVGIKEFDIFYRDKDRRRAVRNIEQFKRGIDDYSGCTGRIRLVNNWRYVGKDSEGYFIFDNKLELL